MNSRNSELDKTWAKMSYLKSAAFRRFQSMPVPFCGFDPSPSRPLTAAKLTTASDEDTLSSPPKPRCQRPSPEGALFIGKASLEDEEGSQDSGVCLDPATDAGRYHTAKDKVFVTDFRFAEPLAPPPRRRVLSDRTNSPVSHKISPNKRSRPHSVTFGSLQLESEDSDSLSPIKLRRSSLTTSPSTDEGDDGFLDLIDSEDSCSPRADKYYKNAPSFVKGLFTGPLFDDKENSPSKTPTTELSLTLSSIEKPASNNAKRGLFRSPSVPNAPRLLTEKSQSFCVRSRPFSFKRSEPCSDNSGTPVHLTKRRKSVVEETNTPKAEGKPRLQRCHSTTEAEIKSALDKMHEQADLIGDHSKAHCLPLIKGKHQDLKSITPETLAKVIQGEYDHVVEKAVIIDCRYPYEYKGGHIKHAKNLYTKAAITEEFLSKTKHKEYQSTDANKRVILVFHCEFSSERAPKMYRFLRNMDRDNNKECYPELAFPEVYLLDGGYKNFFYDQHAGKELCVPKTYMPMNDPNHLNDLKHFRTKSKSWAGERSRPSLRTGLKFC